MPNVGRHPEVLEILRQIARGSIPPVEAYNRLAGIVQIYLWEGACEGHGELVGDHFFRTLILENSKSLLDDDSWVWAQLADSPASPLAVPRAVLQISVLFGATPVELEVQQGARRLYTEYMTSIFPPSPLLFGTDFGDIRKKFPKPEAGRETRK